MTFFLDLWQDLRAKRLWPVAVGLLAAAVAIPVVMLKPAAQPAPPPVIAANTGERGTLPAVSVDSSPTHGSKLQTFAQRNPFKPLADLKKAGANATGSSSGGGTPAVAKAGGSQGSGAGGASSSAAGAGGKSAVASAPSASPSGGSGGSSGSASTPTGGNTGSGTQYYKFTVDLRFGSLDNPKTMKNVETGTRLPSADKPEILFMGLTDGATKALFFIADPALVADGEGECDSPTSCTFVKLGVKAGDNEETFTTADGSVGYTLELLRLNREAVSHADATGDTKPAKGSTAKGSGSAGGKAIADANQAFLPRLISGAQTGSATK